MRELGLEETTDGASVLLTPNEVRTARRSYPNVSLFVLANVKLDGEGDEATASGGSETVYLPWEIDRGTLNPLGYSYEVPPTS